MQFGPFTTTPPPGRLRAFAIESRRRRSSSRPRSVSPNPPEMRVIDAVFSPSMSSSRSAAAFSSAGIVKTVMSAFSGSSASDLERPAAVDLGRVGMEEIDPLLRDAASLDEIPENDASHVHLVRRGADDRGRSSARAASTMPACGGAREIVLRARDAHQRVERDELPVVRDLERIDLDLLDRDG